MASNVELTEVERNQIQQLRAHFPFRRIWFAVHGEERLFICRPTAARANNLARKGYDVFEIRKEG